MGESKKPSAEEWGRFLTGTTMGHGVRMKMTGAMGITFVFIVDAANLFWISLLGDPQMVAAIGFAFAIQYFSVAGGIGLMIASTALVARHIGSGDRTMARQTATSAAIIACLIQSMVAAAIIWFRHDIVAVSGAEGETARLAARYLAMSLPSLSIMAVSMIANGALRAQGDGARSMYVTLTSGAVAMVIDPILIYGLSLGLDGAAIGLNISRCVMLLMALRFAIGTHDLLALPSVADVAATVRPYMGIAVPAILTQMATPAGNYLMTTVMAQFGDDAVAGWAVVGRLTVVAFGGIFSLSGAIGGIFGQNYGARKYDRLKSAYRDAIIFGLIYTGVTWVVLIAVSSLVIHSFQLAPIGADVVYAFVYVGAGGFVFAATLFVSNSAFNALGRPGRSTFTNWMRDGIILLPLALLFADWVGPGGVIYAQAAANTLVGALAALWGWRYVLSMQQGAPEASDLAPQRPYAHADRFRRR